MNSNDHTDFPVCHQSNNNGNETNQRVPCFEEAERVIEIESRLFCCGDLAHCTVQVVFRSSFVCVALLQNT